MNITNKVVQLLLDVYDIPQICLQAWDRAATITNIKS